VSSDCLVTAGNQLNLERTFVIVREIRNQNSQLVLKQLYRVGLCCQSDPFT